MKKYLILCLCVAGALPLYAAKAVGWSWRESRLVRAAPAAWREHTSGPLVQLTPAQIAEAVSFGQACKEKSDVLDYAYIYKAKANALGSDVIYVQIYTPLRLIAMQAAQAARQYKQVDSSFDAYAARLGAIKLSAAQQYMSSLSFRSYAFHRDVILLRDGVRVPELSQLPAWHDANPFDLTGTDPMATAIAAARLAATQYSQHEGGEDTISIPEGSGIYAVAELAKPGHYELVLRAPTTALLPSGTSKEIRFAIDFARFR